MRVLFATTAGAGHFGPLVPFARALLRAGHDVVVTAPGSFASSVARAGLDHRPFADASPWELGAVFETLPGLSPHEANAVVVGEVFARIDTTAALPGVDALVREWRPHLVVRETCEFASYIVAEAAGIPHVHVRARPPRVGAHAVVDTGILRGPFQQGRRRHPAFPRRHGRRHR